MVQIYLTTYNVYIYIYIDMYIFGVYSYTSRGRAVSEGEKIFYKRHGVYIFGVWWAF